MTHELKRLVTGIEGLDALLRGGLVAGAAYIVQGPPGAGKTILANQLACGHVRSGGRVLVATLLSESHERLFQYLGTLDFFDPALVGDQIQFVSAFDTLEQEGLDAVVRLLRQEIARQKATLLVVDGVLNARARAESALDTKKFVSALQGHAAFAGCTVLLLTSARMEEGSPEHTMVDGVIELGEHMVGSRAVRSIQLRKTRGSAALSGRHECLIDGTGMRVFPRLESLFSHPSQHGSCAPGRVSSGVPSLDDMLGRPGSRICDPVDGPLRHWQDFAGPGISQCQHEAGARVAFRFLRTARTSAQQGGLIGLRFSFDGAGG